MLQNWFKILLYNARKNNIFTLLTIIGLALGISSSILATLYWKKEHSYDQWNTERDKIYEVLIKIRENEIWSSNVGPLGEKIKSSGSSVEDYMYYYNWVFSHSFKIDGQSKLIDAYSVQGNFFEFFPFEILKGNKRQFSSKKMTIALSEEESIKLFGDENPIGKVVINEENKVYTIAAVYKKNENSSFSPNAIANDLDINQTDWNNFNYQLLIKLKDSAKIDEAETLVSTIIKKNLIEDYAKRQGLTEKQYIEKYGNIEPLLTKLTDARLLTKGSGLPSSGGNYKFLLINVGISCLILILSILNQVNLNTAYTLKRVREFGVRRVIGASKSDTIIQLIFETSIYVVISMFLGLALTEVLLPYYNVLLSQTLVLDLTNNIVLFCSLLILITSCSAILPALYINHISIQNALKNTITSKWSGGFLRNGLLIIQFAISFIFICCGMMVYKQVNYMINADLGFKGEQIIAATFYNYEQKDRHGYYENALKKLKNIQGVESVAGTNITMGSGSPQSSPIHYLDKIVQSRIVYTEYDLLNMLQVNFIEGRDFDKNITSDSIDNIILNETAIKSLDIKDPINKTIKWNDQMYTIIGVIKDFNTTGFSKTTTANLYIRAGSQNYIRNNIQNIFIKMNAKDTEKTIARIEQLWTSTIDTHYPFEYEFIDKQFAKTYANYIQQRNLFGILNIVVVSIALFGLFALSSFSIERRLKEVAIKKTLGADTYFIIKDLSQRYIVICIVGFIIAILPTYYIIQEWLSNFAYRTEIEPLVFTLSFGLMILFTLIIVISKSLSASQLNPIKYLKYE